MNLKTIPNREFFALVENEIRSGRCMELKIKGSSMQPALMDRKHRVVLVPFRREYLRIGMIALFRYNGKHLLHRLVRIDGKQLTFKGDNLPYTRERVREEDVVAFAGYIITPEGKTIDCTGRGYRIKSRLAVFASRFTAVPLYKYKNMYVKLLKAFRAAART